VSFFSISIVSFGINYYKDILSESFGAKQPHIILKSFSDEVILSKNQREDMINKILLTIGKENIRCITPYIKTTLDLSLEVYANINSPKIEGTFNVIGIYPHYPLAFSFMDAKYFDKEYMPTTYKEFLYDYNNAKNMLIINDVVNKGFSPQLSSNRNKGKMSVYDADKKIKERSFIVGGSIKDYRKEAYLYSSASFANSLDNADENRVSGFAINLQNSSIEHLAKIKSALQKVFDTEYETITWLDKNKKQHDLITLYDMLSNMIQFLILIATSSAILLLIFRTLLSIQPQIRSLYLMGYNVSSNSIFLGTLYLFFFSLVGVFLALFTLSFWYSFSIDFLFESGFMSRIILVEFLFLSLFIIGLSLIFNIKKVEIK